MELDGRSKTMLRLGVLAAASAWVFALAALAGVMAPTAQEERARLASLDEQGHLLNVSADGLEDRLMGSQASVQMWAEMRRRHEQVSALACGNLESHFQDMVKSLTEHEQRSRTRRTRSVAQSEPVDATLTPALHASARSQGHEVAQAAKLQDER